jgi:hypothetical protein
VYKEHFNYDILEEIGLDTDLFVSGKLSPKLMHLDQGEIIFLASDATTPDVSINKHNDIAVGSFLILVSGIIHVDMNSLSGQKILSYEITQPLEACFITASIKISDNEFYANVSSAAESRVIAFSAADFNLALQLSSVFSNIVLKNYTKKLVRLIKFFDKSKIKSL